MKRVNHIVMQVADPHNLRVAFWKARKGKDHSLSVDAYRKQLDHNLMRLRAQILSGLVEVGNYHYFKIFEPKERQICAAAFSEQVLHHALMNICHEHFEQHLISDSYACRKGKGTYAALNQAKRFSCNHKWFLKLDVRKFFESIHHEVISLQLIRMFKDSKIIEIFGKILESYEATPARGVPIGNLTSQYFANRYLSDLDHFVKEDLGIKAYVRYMDDMVLWGNDKNTLQQAFSAVESYLEEKLLCSLKPAQLNGTAQGLPFLGYVIKPYFMRLSQQSKNRFIRKWQFAEARLETCEWSEETYQRHILPLLAFTHHADAKGFRTKLIHMK